MREIKAESKHKINEYESTIRNYQNSIEKKEINYQSNIIKIRNGHELELNKFRTDYDKKIATLHNEIMDFENKIQGYKYDHDNLLS